MKKMLLALGACSLAMAPAMVPTAAAADPGKGPGNDLEEICAQYGAAVGFFSEGECVSQYRADNSAFAAKVCDELQKRDLLGDLGFTNTGQCIAWAKTLI